MLHAPSHGPLPAIGGAKVTPPISAPSHLCALFANRLGVKEGDKPLPIPMGPIHVAPSMQMGTEGTKKGGGRFWVCVHATAHVHPYAQKGGWVAPPSHSGAPPWFACRPYTQLGGEQATGFGHSLQFA